MTILNRSFLAVLLLFTLGLTACDSSTDTDPQPRPTIAALLSQTSNLSTLNAAVNAAGLTETLASTSNRFTVFAPTNAAFNAVLAATGLTAEQLLASDALSGILLFHATSGTVRAENLAVGQTVTTARPSGLATFTIVAAGNGLGIDANGDGTADARITSTNIEASNGVVHIIDAVLVPNDVPVLNLSQVVGTRSNLSVLNAALGATGLNTVLADTGSEFTVFAPTDAAFQALLTALGITASELLALQGIDGVLLYHVTTGSVMAGDLSVGQTVTTARPSGVNTFTVVAAGNGLGIDVNGDGMADARITATDIRATNGIVHVLDAVLVPTDF
jgi:uncharacterized surface protein with fasciclin (FAS1) repeats